MNQPKGFEITVPSCAVWLFDPADPEGETLLLWREYVSEDRAVATAEMFQQCGLSGIVLPLRLDQWQDEDHE